MEVCKIEEDVLTRTTAIVIHREELAPEIIRIRLAPAKAIDFRPGQFIQIETPTGLRRSYSIASIPDDGFLELHIRQLPGGEMTKWIFDEATTGTEISIAGPNGSCYYLTGDPERSLLLVGTGTGLSPLIGIVRDALASGHTGSIHLFHGSWTEEGLYCRSELFVLAEEYANFHYYPCADNPESDNVISGRADHAALQLHTNLKGWTVYLCGHPDMVQFAKKRAFLAGASIMDIYSDPFVICPK